MSGSDEIFLNQRNIRTFLPTAATPKPLAIGIIVVEEDIALNNSEPLQLCQALFHESRAEAVPAVRQRDCKVMQITAPAVVPAEDCTDQLASVTRNKTHSGISFK